jgi:virulence-associated protein VapD
MKVTEYQKKYSSLKKKIENIGFVCTGSVFSTFKTCGNPNCRCHKDKNARHGPYNIWTRKVKAKTITRTLTDEQAQFCRQCIQNMRKLERIVEEMRDLSVLSVEDYEKNPATEKIG